jgi:hypothetical protein
MDEQRDFRGVKRGLCEKTARRTRRASGLGALRGVLDPAIADVDISEDVALIIAAPETRP